VTVRQPRPALGTVLASLPHRSLVSTARELEQLGLDELWLVEDCFQYGAVSATAAILASTERIGVGVGLFPAAVRNAAIFAMELATIAELYPGRLTVGLGHGVEAWMRQIGARPANRVVALSEILVAVRRLLAGETVSLDGRFVALDEVVLEQPPLTVPPVLVGTTGERGVALAASDSDGLLLPEGSGPAAVAWARGVLGPDRRLVVYAWLSLADTRSQALDALAPAIERWRSMGLYGTLAELGRSDPGGGEPVPGLELAGPPGACAEGIETLARAGADAVVLVPAGDDRDAQLRRFAAEVLPLLGDAGQGA
jgi:5,10-methylenetetrahydromethanopterin reductase